MKRLSTGDAFHLRGRKSMGIRGWEGKPVHPPLTDLPIGAFVLGGVLDIIAFAGHPQPWAATMTKAAGWLLIAGVLVALPTALTGLFDRSATTPGSTMRAMTNAHMLAMFTTTGLALGDLAYRYLATTRGRTDGVMLAFACVLLSTLTFGAALGGSLVYDSAFNVDMTEAKRLQQEDEQKAKARERQQDLRRAG